MNKEGGPKKPICTQVTVNETRIKMEIDTGCAVTLIPEKIWRLIKQPALKPTSKRLRTYTGEPVEMLGKFVAEARIEEKSYQLPFYVNGGSGQALLGSNWLQKVKLNWGQIFKISSTGQFIEQYLRPYKSIFKGELGTMKVPKVHLEIKTGSPPKFHLARPIPYALREKVRRDF